ncbi:hypothetical protein ASPZODRAFT_137025 [Penicilliopsis zonata CBS 506.65]|uniref:NAD dependent epimerase/dehydratase n=1 Tax=Penicilliopsis zonata CBS 506.65 TaxID=1073090 RepID=A0A1L9S6T7_9EURO|nr:hypothetical protein ASPZODRAFT_137025 [Penicilliopsis zonata CBS 506.65]OJJ42882.1 hypothetical protein ASPZODRAFT_137025 [Penicilliopsis zonata CBS 506.65]
MFALKRLFYGFPEPSPRIRTKPLQVICVGLPRSATEALSCGLQKLGLETYHGWDLVFEQDGAQIQHCWNLLRRKYDGAPDGDVHITSSEFDVLIGHSEAVIDTVSSFFAVELIEAYPDAKVILNTRRDLDKWHQSITKAHVRRGYHSWVLWVLHIFCADVHWLWEIYFKYGFPPFFRSINGSAKDGIERNGKWVYRDHCNTIRGMVSKDRLLEWTVEDGWEPICSFLDRPVPDEPFPRANDFSAFQKTLERYSKDRMLRCLRNVLLIATSAGVLTASIVSGVKRRGIPRF